MCIYLEPICPLFCLQNKVFSNQNTGHLGSRYFVLRVSHQIHPIGSLDLGFLGKIHRSRAEEMLRKKVAESPSKIPREVVGCDLAIGGEGGEGWCLKMVVLQSIFNDSEMVTTHGFGWKMLKASGRFKTKGCLLRLFIIRHLLGRLTLIKLEWFQISVRVPATCGSCTSFTCTFENIFNDVFKHWSFLVHSKSRSITANSSYLSNSYQIYVCFCYILGIPLRRTPAYPPWFHRYAPCAKSGSFLEVPCSSKSISWVVREVGKWHLPQGCTKTWWKMVGKVVWSIVKLLHICKIHVRTFWVLVSFCSYWVCAIFVTAPTVPTRHTFAWGWKVNEGFPKVQQKGLFG